MDKPSVLEVKLDSVKEPTKSAIEQCNCDTVTGDKSGCVLNERCCHIAGGSFTTTTALSLVTGTILICVCQSPQLAAWYRVGIALLSVTSLTLLLSLGYIASALSRRWRLYGRIEVKVPPMPPHRLLNMNDRDDPFADHQHIVMEMDTVNATVETGASAAVLDWDPDTVLED